MTDREYPSRPWVGVGVIVLRGEEVLLVQRGKPPRLGSWSLPGGAQHLGEGAEAAARRELHEETGIEVGPLELLAVIDGITYDARAAVKYHYTIVDYAAHWQAGEARAGDDVAAVAWARPEELAGYNLTEAVHKVLALARAKLGA